MNVLLALVLNSQVWSQEEQLELGMVRYPLPVSYMNMVSLLPYKGVPTYTGPV